jgi:Tetracyclin repressor-like, C-terminal domain
LERGDSHAPLRAVVSSTKDKVAAIARAQELGELSTRYAPPDLLVLILHLSLLWTTAMPEFNSSAATRRSRAHRRRMVCDAVASLLVE